jgi:hypothetical protein
MLPEEVSMPVGHFVDPALRLVFTKCSGDVSRDDVVTSLNVLKHHPDFEADFRQLVDLTQVSKLNLGFSDMDVIHRVHDPFSNKGKRAVVAPGSGAIFGLARMYQLMVDHENFEVFQFARDAVVWLGRDLSVLTALRKLESCKGQNGGR